MVMQQHQQNNLSLGQQQVGLTQNIEAMTWECEELQIDPPTNKNLDLLSKAMPIKLWDHLDSMMCLSIMIILHISVGVQLLWIISFSNDQQ